MTMAPPSVAFPEDGPPGPRDAEATLYGLLRDVRVNAQTLHDALHRVQVAGQARSVALADQQLQAAFAGEAALLAQVGGQLDAHLQQAVRLCRSVPGLHSRIGDEVTRIVDLFTRCTLDWPQTADVPGELRSKLELLQPLLCDIIFHCGLVTIPSRVNEHLRSLRVGQRLDMATTFSDELCAGDGLARILRYLRDHPATVGGIVDAAAGVVLKASPSPWRRKVTFLVLVAMLALGAGMALAFPYVATQAGVPGWAPDPDAQLRALSLYGALVLGALAHVAIDALKQYRAGPQRDLLALEDWLLWVHVKETSNAVGIVSLWVVFVGLAVSAPQADWATAAFAGYSLDSVMDLFLQRFSGAVAARAEQVAALTA